MEAIAVETIDLTGPAPGSKEIFVIEETLWERLPLLRVPEKLRASLTVLNEDPTLKETFLDFLNGRLNRQDNDWITLDDYLKKCKDESIKIKTELHKFFLVPPNFPLSRHRGLWTQVRAAVRRAGDQGRRHARKSK